MSSDCISLPLPCGCRIVTDRCMDSYHVIPCSNRTHDETYGDGPPMYALVYLLLNRYPPDELRTLADKLEGEWKDKEDPCTGQ